MTEPIATVKRGDPGHGSVWHRIKLWYLRVWDAAQPDWHPGCGLCGACAAELRIRDLTHAQMVHLILDHWDLVAAIHETEGKPDRLAELDKRIGGLL
jgi:hypothetical protein